MTFADNQDARQLKDELKRVLEKFEVSDIITLVSQYPDSPTRGSEPRLVWLVKALQLAAQGADELLAELSSTKLFKKAKLRKNFESSLLITIEDETERSRKSQTPLFESMVEDIRSPPTVLIEEPGHSRADQDGHSLAQEGESNGTHARRKRSSLHKQFKNQRQAINRKKLILLQRLNLQ